MAARSLRRTVSRALTSLQLPSSCRKAQDSSRFTPRRHSREISFTAEYASLPRPRPQLFGSRRLSSLREKPLGPAAIDYSSTLQEDDYHSLANSTIHDLLEKLEEYGDMVEIDGFDVDYGNEVLTLKLGGLGTYVINKQTPNRQIWMSSPVSGPSRFDWDHATQSWVYRRTKGKLFNVLETELEELCGRPINLS